jgi:hypothetical protein
MELLGIPMAIRLVGFIHIAKRCDMPTIKIKAYDAVISCDWLGDGASVLLGVAEDGHPEDAYFDSWADEKIYFFLTGQEMESLKAGDVLNDGEDFTILSIDKDNPAIFEVDYELEGVQ